MNKKECYKYANSKTMFFINNGLLSATLIKHIISTSMKNIAGRRTLVLYFYNREALLQGTCSPQFIIFQSKEDYITLDQSKGTVIWRTACIGNLLNGEVPYNSAFYTKKDEELVRRFFKSEDSGVRALLDHQRAIIERRRKSRIRREDKRTLAAIKEIGPVPRGFKGWIHREVLPAYIYYVYHKSKPMQGFCTGCRHDVLVSEAKHNKTGKCPRCHREITFKAAGKTPSYFTDYETVQFLERSSIGITIRIFKARYIYENPRDTKLELWESARLFVSEEGSFEAYYDSQFLGELTTWKQGYRPWTFGSSNEFKRSECGYLYCKNLNSVIEGTIWQYCQLKQFYLTSCKPMEIRPFLEESSDHPQLELLIKMQLFNLVSDLVYRERIQSILDLEKKKLYQILRVWPEDVKALQTQNASASQLSKYQKFCMNGITPSVREKLNQWMEKQNITEYELHIIFDLLKTMSFHKLKRYLESQYILLKNRISGGSKRYGSFVDLLTEYRDYQAMCTQQNYDLQDNSVLYPKDLQKAHDQCLIPIKKERQAYHRRQQAKLRAQFKSVYIGIGSTMDFEKDGLKLVVPRTPRDLTMEGKNLHHCVGSYVQDVTNGNCVILFIRRTSCPEESFYTIEVRGSEVVQVRGQKNSKSSPEIDEFITEWKNTVLKKAELQQIA